MTAVIARQSWMVRRSVTITRERVVDEDGDTDEIQYTVQIWDTGRDKPFIQQSFGALLSAESFVARIRKESEYESHRDIITAFPSTGKE